MLDPLSTLHALAEAANRPEPPRTYRGPDGFSWVLSREAWKTAQSHYWTAIESMGPAGMLRLIAVAEAAEGIRKDVSGAYGQLCVALAALKEGDNGR